MKTANEGETGTVRERNAAVLSVRSGSAVEEWAGGGV